MFVEATEAENELNCSEISPRPILRSSLSIPNAKQHDGGYSSTKPHSIDRQASRISIHDFSVFNSMFSNLRTSVHGNRLVKQFRERYANDSVEDEVDYHDKSSSDRSEIVNEIDIDFRFI